MLARHTDSVRRRSLDGLRGLENNNIHINVMTNVNDTIIMIMIMILRLSVQFREPGARLDDNEHNSSSNDNSV